jgi:hypothetical protein
MFTEVNWTEVPALVGSAVLGSLLLAVLKQLPEAPQPLASPTVGANIYVNASDQPTEAAIPVVAVADTAESNDSGGQINISSNYPAQVIDPGPTPPPPVEEDSPPEPVIVPEEPPAEPPHAPRVPLR